MDGWVANLAACLSTHSFPGDQLRPCMAHGVSAFCPLLVLGLESPPPPFCPVLGIASPGEEHGGNGV